MENTIVTEQLNENTINIDIASTLDIVKMLNNEDLKIALAVQKELDSIAFAVDLISNNFLKGGRLLYFGAGTSGRLGVLDASECPPTFNTPFEMVQGIIAGGDKALRFAIEGAEDSCELARQDFERLNIKAFDTVVSISASGNANYVVEILKLAKEKKVKTIALTSNPSAEIAKIADVSICIETGPEAISGSTRLKAGSAQKMVLNMLSTASMIRIGKVYKNLMVDVKPTNIKLKKRAVAIVSEIAAVSHDIAEKMLEKNSYNVKEAVLQLMYKYSFGKASEILLNNNGILRKALAECSKENF